MSIVSNNIKYLRRLNGLTQEQFARRIGIKRSLLGAYEEARANPNLDNLKVIANTFGVSVDNLIKVDIRKLRDTPDLTFGFQAKPTPEPSPQPVQQPKLLSEMVNNFMKNPPQPAVNISYKSTGIKLVSQKVVFKPVNKNANFQTNLYPSQQPRFNNIYEKETSQVVDNQRVTSHQVIQLVKKNQFNEYLNRYQDSIFLNTLSEFQIPSLPTGEYRAFEANEDFAFENSLLIGSYIRNWFEILDGKNYVLITKSMGIIYRRVYNQVKNKGNLLLSADSPKGGINNQRVSTSELPIKDVLEVWEVRAFISQKLPEPSISFDKLNSLVEEMKFELERIRQ